MNFELNKTDAKKLEQLINAKYDNINASELILELIDKFENENLTDEFAFVNDHDAYINKLKELFNYEEASSEEKSFFESKILTSIKQIDLSNYRHSSYGEAVNNVQFKQDKLLLTTHHYKRNQLFVFDDVTTSGEYYEEHLSSAYSAVDFPYVTLLENHAIWMAIIPHEINTMQHAIDEANGHVLVLGLGLGYYPFEISLKDNVKRIIIVEKNKRIIELFKTNILPHFPHKEKIEIVEADAYRYMREKGKEFSYAFFDIYRSSDDGLLLYVKAKRQEKYYPTLPVSYWLEGSLLAHLRRVVISLIEEKYYGYISEECTPLDKLFNHLEKKIGNITFTSYKAIHDLLKDDSLKTLIQ